MKDYFYKFSIEDSRMCFRMNISSFRLWKWTLKTIKSSKQANGNVMTALCLMVTTLTVRIIYWFIVGQIKAWETASTYKIIKIVSSFSSLSWNEDKTSLTQPKQTSICRKAYWKKLLIPFPYSISWSHCEKFCHFFTTLIRQLLKMSPKMIKS